METLGRKKKRFVRVFVNGKMAVVRCIDVNGMVAVVPAGVSYAVPYVVDEFV